MNTEIRCNDNVEELKKLPSESIDMVYLDPPFNTGKKKKDYDDRFDSMDDYINFMKPRIKEIHRALKPTGTLYLHSDKNASHYLKVMTDEIFGIKRFLNEITWKRTATKTLSKRNFPDTKDTILVYSKGNDYTFNPQKKTNKRDYPFNDEKGRYRLLPVLRKFHPVNKTSGDTRYFNDIKKEITLPKGYVWIWNQDRIEKYLDDGFTFSYSKEGLPRSKKYREEGDTVDTIWTDVFLHSSSKERVGYSTQKPKSLLKRIIKASTDKGDVVLDAFAGSGTTCAVANELGRKSICIDNNPKACKIMEKRLL